MFIKEISEYVELHKDDRTGIAYVKNGKTGNVHTAHPNIDSSGSVSGMIKKGYWSKSDKTVRAIGAIHNISKCAVHDDLDEIARNHCSCGGKHS